jgi:hypothetical protein
MTTVAKTVLPIQRVKEIAKLFSIHRFEQLEPYNHLNITLPTAEKKNVINAIKLMDKELKAMAKVANPKDTTVPGRKKIIRQLEPLEIDQQSVSLLEKQMEKYKRPEAAKQMKEKLLDKKKKQVEAIQIKETTPEPIIITENQSRNTTPGSAVQTPVRSPVPASVSKSSSPLANSTMQQTLKIAEYLMPATTQISNNPLITFHRTPSPNPKPILTTVNSNKTYSLWTTSTIYREFDTQPKLISYINKVDVSTQTDSSDMIDNKQMMKIIFAKVNLGWILDFDFMEKSDDNTYLNNFLLTPVAHLQQLLVYCYQMNIPLSEQQRQHIMRCCTLPFIDYFRSWSYNLQANLV